jgi:hypothetical protein
LQEEKAMGANYHTAWAAGMTQFKATSMNPALDALDKAITYATKSPIVHCDGDITWSNGTLTWGGTIRILFNREDGQAIQNTIAASNIALADNEFCYVDLSETNNTALTMNKASVTTGAASNFLALARLVMAYRNTTNDELYPVWLPGKFKRPDEMVQTLTDAATVTIDWSLGSTAQITLDRATTTFAFTGARNGQRCVLTVKQYSGPGAVAFGSEARGGTDLTLPPTLTATAGKKDYLEFIYNGADSKYDFVNFKKGY